MRNVAEEPVAEVVCLDLGRDSWATYDARFWIVDLGPDEATASMVRGRVHAALRRAGIPLARPSQTYFNIGEDADEHLERREHREERALRVLDQVPLFASLNAEERKLLAEKLIFSPFDQGEVITRQGSIAHYLYLLERGVAEVRTTLDNGATKVVATLKAPAFFGEMGLMTGEPRLANVIAVTPTICYRLDKAAFEGVLQRRPALAAEVSAVLASRRVELLAIRGMYGDGDPQEEEKHERERILKRVRTFFGIDD
jgi:CRP-like cAMP-binding protein